MRRRQKSSRVRLRSACPLSLQLLCPTSISAFILSVSRPSAWIFFLPFLLSNHPYPKLQGLSLSHKMATLTEAPLDRFRQHVGFDNVPSGEATKNNTLSLTLNRKHNAYTARRRSRSFMVGIDGHQNSDYAVQWLLEMLVDDGDEVICVHVVEKEYRWNDKQYRDDAERLFEGILKRNSRNRALSFVLEYAVGKLHATFQMLVSATWRRCISVSVGVTRTDALFFPATRRCKSTSQPCSSLAPKVVHWVAFKGWSILAIRFPSTACSTHRSLSLSSAQQRRGSRRR